MVRLWYSNQLERLVDALCANLDGEDSSANPLEPVTVLVPNRNIATYLKLEVARKRGILANVEFTYLYAFFGDLVPPDSGLELLTKEALASLLVDVFGDPRLLDVDELAPVRAYIDAAGDDPDIRDQRRFQLASEIARLFEEYSLSRPRMLELWADDTVVEGPPYDEVERWQRRLWLEIFGDEGRLAALAAEQGRRLVPIARLMNELRARGEGLGLPGRVHVFGLSYVARVFYDVFYELGRALQLHVYTLNPCMEYWEDVPAGWKVQHREVFARRTGEQSELTELLADGGSLFDPEEDTAPLRLWGKPGRDHIRMLNMLTDSDFEPLFVDPLDGGDSLLHRVQRDILTREPASISPRFAGHFTDDASVQFLECPNVQREVEIVASEIWALLEEAKEKGEELAFNDIAVIVPHNQREAYQARIRSVFQSTYAIPHNVIDIEARSHRRYLEAVELLLALPFGRFKRDELLRLLTHPNVVEGCDGVEPDTWIRWVDELNVLHGADAADHAETYLCSGPGDDANLFHWDQGLRRLVLGSFMCGEAGGDARIYEPQGQAAYLPHELGQQDVASASQLVVLARSLIADARFCRDTERPLADWFALMSEMVSTYLVPAGDEDEYDRMRVLDRLGDLADIDLSSSPVSYRVAFEFARRMLGGLEISRGQYLAEGVVVSSFLPMRPIPFQVVFVTGMGEKQFPRPEHKSPLDLRWANSTSGDPKSVLTNRLQDEYMFLETLMSTRERLYLSYVWRDAQTGEELEPSSVIRELMFMLRRGYITREELDARIVRHPLRRYDHGYFPELLDGTAGSRPTGESADDLYAGIPDLEDEGTAGSRPTGESADDLYAGIPDLDEEEGPTATSRRALRSYHPEARKEAQTLAVRQALERFCSQFGVGQPDLDTLREELSPEAWKRTRELLGLCPLPSWESVDPEDRVEVSISRIRKFLQTPLQGAAQFYLGLRDEEQEDLFAVEDELFETGSLETAILLRDVFLRSMRARHEEREGADEPDELGALYDALTRRRELAGLVPTGLFRRADRAKHLRILERWRANLEPLGLRADSGLRVVNFGRAPEHAVATDLHEPLRLMVPVDDPRGTRLVRVDLVGKTDPFCPVTGCSLALRTSSSVGDKPGDERYFVPGFVDHAILSLAELRDDQPWAVAISADRHADREKHRREFEPFSKREAQQYLTAIVRDMLSGAHAYLLPVEAVFDHRLGRGWKSLPEIVDGLKNNTWSFFSCRGGPIRNPERFEAPADAEAIIDRRFGAYLDRVRGGRR